MAKILRTMTCALVALVLLGVHSEKMDAGSHSGADRAAEVTGPNGDREDNFLNNYAKSIADVFSEEPSTPDSKFDLDSFGPAGCVNACEPYK